MSDWKIFKGLGQPAKGDPITDLPPPPPWRKFDDEERDKRRGITFRPSQAERDKTLEMVNAALYLRRPLLVTGKPGSGKSSLAYAIAEELKLGKVLKWPINTRSTLQEGLYRYDAIARLRAAQSHAQTTPAEQDTAQQVGRYIRLGPLGTALLPSQRPRVLLIDEIDKGDVDLPNDLLHVFEEGEFVVPEITRLLPQDARELPASGQRNLVPVDVQTDEDAQVAILNGRVRCTTFPILVLTSNGERDFPPAFLRRCLRLDILPPTDNDLQRIVEAHLKEDFAAAQEQIERYISAFVTEREQKRGELSTDQMLNLIYLLIKAPDLSQPAEELLKGELLRSLS